MKYPIYDAVIKNSEDGTFCVSLVDNPATEVGFVVFDEDKPIVKFSVDDEKERIVSGIIMLADTPIYRRTVDNFEYYIKFSKDTLKLMAEKMIFDGVGSSVNIQHENNSYVDGVNLLELFIVDREKGINPTYFENVPDGSLVGSYKIHNDEVWEMIMKGEVLSFSLEGIFTMVEEKFENIEETYNKENKLKNKMSKIKEMLRKLLAQFGEVSTDKGVLAWQGDEDLKEGDLVQIVDAEGNEVKPEDGEYRTEVKTIIVVEDGKVTEVKDVEDEKDEEVEEPKEDVVEVEAEVDETKEEVVEEVEEEPKEDEIAKIKEDITKIFDLIEEIKSQLQTSDERFKKLEEMPMAKSATETFEDAKDKEDNSIRGKMSKRGYKF